MGVAFSSSLLGLAGSLLVGLLELFAGHGQNRFYRELEEMVCHQSRDWDFHLVMAKSPLKTRCSLQSWTKCQKQMDAMRSMFEQSDETRSMVDGKNRRSGRQSFKTDCST